MRRRELRGQDDHRFGRRRKLGHRVENDVRIGLVRLRAERRRREGAVVGLQLRNAHAALDHHLAEALRHAHRRQDRRRGVRPLDQVDLVDGDQLLVEAARHLGLGLVVEQHVLDGPAKEAVPAVDLLDHDLRGDLVDHRGLREEARTLNTAIDPETGYNDEESKVIKETRKIFEDDTIAVGVTCVRVPVLRAHCEAITFECERPITEREVRAILARAPGVRIVDDRAKNYFPMPVDASGQDDVLVGRIRKDLSDPSGHSISMFVSADQLLKGAALNAIQIAELLPQRAMA